MYLLREDLINKVIANFRALDTVGESSNSQWQGMRESIKELQEATNQVPLGQLLFDHLPPGSC